MKKKKIIDLIKPRVKFNKRTVSMPIPAWELIEVILKQIGIKYL